MPAGKMTSLLTVTERMRRTTSQRTRLILRYLSSCGGYPIDRIIYFQFTPKEIPHDPEATAVTAPTIPSEDTIREEEGEAAEVKIAVSLCMANQNGGSEE